MSISKEVKFALIGCGRIAERHIDAIQQTTRAKLVAVCDLNKILAAEKALLANVPFYTHYDKMLQAHPEIEVVSILTPSGAHFYHAADIITRYKKHLMIEKPFVLTLTHAAELQTLAKDHGVTIFPIYQNRFNKAVQFVKSSLEDTSSLGKLRIGTVRLRWCRPQRYYDLSNWRGTWAMDGGAVTNQGIHYLDLLRYVCGNVKRVHARLATLGADIEVEDTAVAMLEFENGALGVIEIMTSARPKDFEASISAVCENGLAVISGIATNELITYSPNESACLENSEVFPTVYGLGHNVMIESVVNTLLDKQAPLISYQDGLETLKLLHAIYRSDELDDWVTVNAEQESVRLGKKDANLLNGYLNSEIKSEETL